MMSVGHQGRSRLWIVHLCIKHARIKHASIKQKKTPHTRSPAPGEEAAVAAQRHGVVLPRSSSHDTIAPVFNGKPSTSSAAVLSAQPTQAGCNDVSCTQQTAPTNDTSFT
jgi:hypothetical protein